MFSKLTLITSSMPDVELFAKVGNQENYSDKICFFFNLFFLSWAQMCLKHSIGCNLRDCQKDSSSIPDCLTVWVDSASLKHSFIPQYCVYAALVTLLYHPFIPNFKAYAQTIYFSFLFLFPLVWVLFTGPHPGLWFFAFGSLVWFLTHLNLFSAILCLHWVLQEGAHWF